MTAGNALTPALPPDSTPQHTTVIRGPRVESVSFFDEEERGLWFPVLKSLIRSGLWRTLSPAAKALLPVMCMGTDPFNPRSPHTLCTATDDELCALAGIERRALFGARKSLADLGLIRKTRGGLWEVFPNRQFASRTPRPSLSTSAPACTKSAPPCTPPLPESAPACTKSAPPCTPPLPESAPACTKSAPPCTPLLRREREQSSSDSENFAAAALLRGEGFGDQDVADLTPLVSLAKLRGYIGNADQLDREGKLRNRRGYLRDAIRKGYSLFAKVELRLVKERRPELAERLRLIMRGRLDLTREDHQALVRVYPDPDKTLDRGGITAAELDSHPDQEAFDLIKTRAVERARSTQWARTR